MPADGHPRLQAKCKGVCELAGKGGDCSSETPCSISAAMLPRRAPALINTATTAPLS